MARSIAYGPRTLTKEGFGFFLGQSWTGWEGFVLVFKEGNETDVGPEGEGVTRGLFVPSDQFIPSNQPIPFYKFIHSHQ
jgi:hypothetical protein